jgi:hypothetical protein
MRALMAGLAAALGLAGCASGDAGQVGTPVDSALAQALGSPSSKTATYQPLRSARLTLQLGATYDSADGRACRLGRAADTTAYAFCRSGNAWFAMPPAILQDR